MSRVKWSRKYDAKLRRDGRTPLIFHQKIMTLNFENHGIFERNKKIPYLLFISDSIGFGFAKFVRTVWEFIIVL